MSHIVTTGGELNEIIRKVFDSFDADKSGFIDLSELKAVSKELGSEMSDAEADAAMKDLDVNKDGKISFEEF